jgi:hypothetical protein
LYLHLLTSTSDLHSSTINQSATMVSPTQSTYSDATTSNKGSMPPNTSDPNQLTHVGDNSAVVDQPLSSSPSGSGIMRKHLPVPLSKSHIVVGKAPTRKKKNHHRAVQRKDHGSNAFLEFKRRQEEKEKADKAREVAETRRMAAPQYPLNIIEINEAHETPRSSSPSASESHVHDDGGSLEHTTDRDCNTVDHDNIADISQKEDNAVSVHDDAAADSAAEAPSVDPGNVKHTDFIPDDRNPEVSHEGDDIKIDEAEDNKVVVPRSLGEFEGAPVTPSAILALPDAPASASILDPVPVEMDVDVEGKITDMDESEDAEESSVTIRPLGDFHGAPVTPAAILALPNSLESTSTPGQGVVDEAVVDKEVDVTSKQTPIPVAVRPLGEFDGAPVTPGALLALPDSPADFTPLKPELVESDAEDAVADDCIDKSEKPEETQVPISEATVVEEEATTSIPTADPKESVEAVAPVAIRPLGEFEGAPTTPVLLLALPNSADDVSRVSAAPESLDDEDDVGRKPLTPISDPVTSDVDETLEDSGESSDPVAVRPLGEFTGAPTTPALLLALPNSLADTAEGVAQLEPTQDAEKAYKHPEAPISDLLRLAEELEKIAASEKASTIASPETTPSQPPEHSDDRSEQIPVRPLGEFDGAPVTPERILALPNSVAEVVKPIVESTISKAAKKEQRVILVPQPKLDKFPAYVDSSAAPIASIIGSALNNLSNVTGLVPMSRKERKAHAEMLRKQAQAKYEEDMRTRLVVYTGPQHAEEVYESEPEVFSPSSSSSQSVPSGRAVGLANNTFLGACSLADFLAELIIDDGGSTYKDHVIAAFGRLSAMWQDFIGINAAQSTLEQLRDPVTQCRTKLGDTSLWVFLRDIEFDEDDMTSIVNVANAFRKAARNDAKPPSNQLAKLLELEAGLEDH